MVHFKTAQVVHFVLCVFYHKFKNNKNKRLYSGTSDSN